MEISDNFQDIKTRLNEISSKYKNILLQTHNKALLQNAIQVKRWEDYKNDHVSLCDRLLSLRDELSHPAMVPIGKKALMRGRLVHTNEILVSLGDGWFAKRTAKQAVEICHRRIKHCDEMLAKLKKEEELLESRRTFPFKSEAFGGSDQTQEIIEPFDEEEEKQWREKHRQKEKEYRQKLAELKKVPKATIETEEDLWKRLDALDLQEELEDELNRMDETIEDEEEESDSESDPGTDEEASDSEEEREEKCLQRKVSFKEENASGSDNLGDGEDIVRIVFKHSNAPVPVPSVDSGEILSPSDIYLKYSKQKAPKSILKPSVVNHLPAELEKEKPLPVDTSNVEYHSSLLPVEPAVKAIGDQVLERTAIIPTVSQAERPVSRFKAARMSSKR